MTELALDDADELDAPTPRRTLRWLVIAAGAVAVVPLLFLLGNRLGKDPTLVRTPLLGKAAPSFDLPRIDAPGRVGSDDLAGRLYVINFWASWCVPCREETPVLEEFYRRYRDDGLELVGIGYADTPKDALAFRRELGGSWPIVDDPQGRTALDYGVRGVPETFVVDARGRIMAKLIGAVRPGVLDQVLAQIARTGEAVTAKNDRYRTSR